VINERNDIKSLLASEEKPRADLSLIFLRGNAPGFQEQTYHQHLLVLGLCHSLVAVVDDKRGDLSYRTPSPDEAALHSWIMQLDFQFLKRTTELLVLREGRKPLFSLPVFFASSFRSLCLFAETETSFALLADLEFSSERARMSVLVRCPDGRALLLAKGADSIIYKLLRLFFYINFLFSDQ